MLVHVFGARDSACCASFALKQTAVDSQGKFNQETIEAVIKDFYVDDFLKSVETTHEANRLAKELKEMLLQNGFNLTKFVSNNNESLKDIAECDLRKSTENITLEKSDVERALGIIWDISNDVFTFSSSSIKAAPFTKRGVLKVLSSLFDPLGFLIPFIVIAKILFQDLWRRGCSWDEPLTESEKVEWSNWLEELKEVATFEIKRWHANSSDIESIELHIFVDASESSFGAVAYVRTMYKNGEISCYLLMSRSRLAPIKVLTIVRLELQSAVLGVRLYNVIIEETPLEFKRVCFWTDSMITLQYLNNETKRFKIFVANRVSEIREHTNPKQWFHVPGELNPADDTTRGLRMKDIVGHSRWIYGPELLYQDETKWPHCKDIPSINLDLEIRATVGPIGIENLLAKHLKVYSSWQRMLNVMGWILRFINNAKEVNERKTSGFLKVSELRKSHNKIMKLSQSECFAEEGKALERNVQIPQNSKLLHLQPYVDSNGIIRVGGRLKRSNINVEARHQVILHAENWASKALVTQLHRMNIHEGPCSLLATLRERFWIIGANRLVKSVIRTCFECKKRNVKPAVPIMADLPESRTKVGCPVFFYCGIDFFGPLLTKLRRGTQKRWGCIFTCMCTRAIHLEVVEGLDTDSFINTLRRFINRRGNPKEIISDCGSNFKGADAELKRALREIDNSKIGKFAAEREIIWKFNPPNAPHMGGVWERLVRTVKRPLQVILKDRTVTDFQLMTIFAEIEGLVNSRPLTPSSNNINDYEALTPNHFLIGRSSANVPFAVHYETDIHSRKRWKQVQHLTNQFWRRWQREYLPSITIRPKWHKDQPNIKPGDLVLLVEDDIPRGKWQLARVRKVHPGNDGKVRVVEVKTSTNTYVRPVSKLCLIEESI